MVYQKPNRKISIFEELKLAIMQGVYKPRERLLERELAVHFGVSRTPIREALRRLENTGMVRIVPNQGAQVADFSIRDIENLYLVRIRLEKLAATLACSFVTPEEVKKLSAISQELKKAIFLDDFHQMIEWDQKFHLRLLNLSKNPYLMKVIEEFRLKSYPISYYLWKSKKNIRKSLGEHKGMIQALKRQDQKKISSLVETQLNNSKDFYMRSLSENSTV